MNTFICNNPRCGNYGRVIDEDMASANERRYRDEYEGRVAWITEGDMVTPCCRTDLFEELTPSQLEEMEMNYE